MADKRQSHQVIVHFPNSFEPQPLEIGVQPTSLCSDLFNKITKLMATEENETFGLSVIKDDG